MFFVLLLVVLLVRCAPAAFPRRQEYCRLRHSARLDSSTLFANFFFFFLFSWLGDWGSFGEYDAFLSADNCAAYEKR